MAIISTTRTPGQFAAERFFTPKGSGRWQWDYRDSRGVLHSGVARSRGSAVQAACTAAGEFVESEMQPDPVVYPKCREVSDAHS